MNISVEPVKLDGQFFVAVIIGGTAMEPKGPYLDADVAEAVARRLRWFGRALANSSGGNSHG